MDKIRGVHMSEEEKESTSLATRRDNSMRRSMFGGFDSLFNEFRRDFDNMMNLWYPRTTSTIGIRRIGYPATDIVDNGGNYTVKADLPGLTKDKIEVKLTDDMIEISGKEEQEVTEEGKNYLMKERSSASFQRKLTFPEAVLPDKAEAEMKDGILMIHVPKREPAPKEKLVKLDIK
jgi:HSP20 family molecular chaperone IbpA